MLQQCHSLEIRYSTGFDCLVYQWNVNTRSWHSSFADAWGLHLVFKHDFWFSPDLTIPAFLPKSHTVFPSRQDRKINSFVRFLGEVTAGQFCFEIYWSLERVYVLLRNRVAYAVVISCFWKKYDFCCSPGLTIPASLLKSHTVWELERGYVFLRNWVASAVVILCFWKK